MVAVERTQTVAEHLLSGLILILLILTEECSSWPEGTYGLPMPEAGCPRTEGFQWLTGTRIQETEPESHSSNPIHLAGMKSEQSDVVVQNFCMKTSYPQYGKFRWQKGSYCIFKKGDCPKNFKSGWVYWDDAAAFFGSTIQNFSGTVPDGEYGRNTKVEFCCRKDGSISKEIVLPTASPFYLFRIAEGCQKVKNTLVTEEWVYWADEDLVNLSGYGGMYPKVHLSKHPMKYTKLYYCYYVPNHVAPKNYHTTMIVIYCVSGIVSLFLLAFVITLLVQKCCTRKQTPPYIVESVDNTAHEAMITPAASAVVATGSEGAPQGTAALHISRRNGTANRDNEMEYYPDKRHTASPPRYSQLESRKPIVASPEEVVPMVTLSHAPVDGCMTLPPSYDDVVRQDQEGTNMNV